MQQKVNKNNSINKIPIASSIILTFFLIWNIGLFFTKTALSAKILAAGSFFILISILILFWKETLKHRRTVNT